MSSNIKASTWKQFFLSTKDFNYPTSTLLKVKAAGATGNSPEEIFTDFSRNHSI
jgi:hypothetical protein